MGSRPDSLLLSDLLDIARVRSPRLHAAGAAVAASRAREGAAGVPPDPMVEVGAMNLSIPGLRADMPASMAPSIQVLQTVPFPGKLGLAGRIAERATAVEAAAEGESWWALRARVAAGFYELYEADRAIAVAAETLALLRDLEVAARSLYAAGTGRQADVLRGSVEVARARAELTRLETGRRAAAARLNALVGVPVAGDVASPALAALPLELPPADTLLAWADGSRPLLEGLRLRVEQAGSRRALARREIWPDLTLGIQYGQSRGFTGTERMGGAVVGFSVPVFAGRRQLRARDEAAALEAAVRAELAAERAVVEARIHEQVAVLEETRALISLYRGEVLPQASANMASALAAYRAGTVDFLTLIEAQLGHNTYRRELNALVAEYGAAIAELESTIGRELSATGHILAEVR
jgi:outer membrane protein TolC